MRSKPWVALLLVLGLLGPALADGPVRPSREGPAIVATWRREREPRALPAVVPAGPATRPALPREKPRVACAPARPVRWPGGLLGWAFRTLR